MAEKRSRFLDAADMSAGQVVDPQVALSLQEAAPPDDPMMEIPDTGGGEPATFVMAGDSLQPSTQDEEGEAIPTFFQHSMEESMSRLRELSRSKLASRLLGEAADILLSVMNPSLVEFFKERCQQLGAKPWQVACTILHQACELRAINYYPETFGLPDAENQTNQTPCRNCGHGIPSARLAQKYCCEKCSAYAQGSKYVKFGTHDETCPISGANWLREPGEGQNGSQQSTLQ